MAERATIILEARTDEARESVQRLQGELDQVSVEAAEAGDGFSSLSNDAARELAETRSQAERTSAAMRSVSGSASTTANSLGIELTQAAQDASFGVAGVANQIPQLQLEFQRLRSQTGSTTGALSTLASTFAGPTGALAAGTLLLQFMPQIISAFSEAEDQAEDTAESVEKIAESVNSVLEVTSDQTQDLELGLDDTEQALSTAEGRVETLQSRIDALERLRALVSPIEEVRQQERTAVGQEQAAGREERSVAEIIAQTRERFNLENATQEEITQRVESLQQELRTEKGVRDELENQREALNRQLRVQERLEELGANRAEDSKDAAGAAEREAEAMNGLAVSAKQAAENRQTLRRFQAAGGRQGRMFDPISFGRTPTVGGTMLRNTRQPGARMLQAAREAGFISEFRDYEQVVASFQSESESAFSAVQLGAQAATSATNALAQSLARGESFARGLQGTFSQLLSQVGSSLLQKAITGGSALGLSGGPLAAIGLGGGLLGGVLGAFDSGGRVGTPLQIVGENGPELAAMPQGSRVVSNAETRRMIDQASRGAGQVQVQIKTEMRRLANGDLGVAVREANQRNALYNP